MTKREKECDCTIHRYHCCHTIKGQSEVYSHSSSAWDYLKRFDNDMLETWDSRLYVHGMTAEQLRQAAQVTSH